MSGIEGELTRLATLSSAELREMSQRATGSAVPKVSPNLLRLALGYELQARALGGLSRKSQQRLAQLAAARTRTTAAQPGMRLAREWHGAVHVVVIGEDGTARWNDREWHSLSEVARTITGTRWSGSAFFGLKRRVAA